MQRQAPADGEIAAWPAPRSTGRISATVALPGSKSLTNRLLLLGAIADGPSRLRAPLRARDTELMAAALRDLGVGVTDVPSDNGDRDAEGGADWLIEPAPMHGADIDTGLAGTVMRFVPPIAALADGRVGFDGDPYARERPMASLIDGLRQAGVEIDDGGRDHMPFSVIARGAVPGGPVRIDASASSQFVSGLLLAGARYDKGVDVAHSGAGAVPSLPHIDMTLEVLCAAGVDAARVEPGLWHVSPGPVAAFDRTIEPDLSNAAPFLAAALVTGGTVKVPNWPTQTNQAGDALRWLLPKMGAEVELDADGLTVKGNGHIAALEADLRDYSELVTVIAALAALADGPSTLSGLGHMRGHETDRLAALSCELTRVGVEVVEEADRLIIVPRDLHGGLWHAYADHRMATAGAVLGLAVDDMQIDDIRATTKTMPDFPGMWTSLVQG